MAEDLTFEHRMSASDALMWNIEKDPMLRSTIVAVAVLDRAPHREKLVARIDRATRLVPRMRQRVVSSPLSVAPPRWAVDPNFDLDYHIRFLNAPDAGSMADLLRVAEPMGMQGFDRARPLWEMAVVEGLEGGRAAVIQKIHHAITDGVGGIKIAMHLVDLDREPANALEDDLPPAPEADEWSYGRRMVDASRHEVSRQVHRLRRTLSRLPGAATDPVATARNGAATLASVGRLLRPVTEPMSPIMRRRSLSVRFDSITVPLADLKAAANMADAKLNDAFVAAVTGGLRRYHAHHGAEVEALRMNMPINIRDHETESLAGNQFVPARFAVPIHIDDPLERMRTVRQLVTSQRAEPALRFTGLIAEALNRLPTSVTTQVFGDLLRGIDFTTSNVPGVDFPIFLAGAQLEALIPFGPLAGSAASVVLVSHLDQVNMGINMDPAAIPDTERFVECLRDGFDEVLKLG
jgi:WS/DGAT/MGAT family acyltransferase